MINRNGNFKGRFAVFLVTLLGIPLLGWNVLPQAVSRIAVGSSRAVMQSISVQKSPASSVERGQALFMGRVHFENGGPPCMGCHNIGSNGILGGGALGPDLTNVAARRSQSQLAEILANPVSVAKPIYAEHPLTAAEQADLLAFLNASVGQPETNREWLVISISLVGFLAAIVLIQLVYRQRLRGVRKPMVRQAYLKK